MAGGLRDRNRGHKEGKEAKVVTGHLPMESGLWESVMSTAGVEMSSCRRVCEEREGEEREESPQP